MTNKNINPLVWGPSIWSVLHTISFYCKTPEQAQQFIALCQLLTKLLPCESCREHFTKLIYTNRFNYQNQESCFKYTYQLHSEVNNRLGKISPSYDYIYKLYSNYSCSEDDYWIMLSSIAFVFTNDNIYYPQLIQSCIKLFPNRIIANCLNKSSSIYKNYNNNFSFISDAKFSCVGLYLREEHVFFKSHCEGC